MLRWVITHPLSHPKQSRFLCWDHAAGKLRWSPVSAGAPSLMQIKRESALLTYSNELRLKWISILIDFLAFESQGRVWLLFWQTGDFRSVNNRFLSKCISCNDICSLAIWWWSRCKVTVWNENSNSSWCLRSNIFLRKDDSLSGKSISSSSWRSAADSILSHVKFILSSWIANSSFVFKSSKMKLLSAEAKFPVR